MQNYLHTPTENMGETLQLFSNLLERVVKMRQSQRAYFASRSWTELDTARGLEKMVDRDLYAVRERLHRLINGNQ